MNDYILINACILTIDQNRRILLDGAIVIKDDKIVNVGITSEILLNYIAKKTIDLKGYIVMPGLVDTHAHAGHALVSTVVKDTVFWMDVHNHIYSHYLSDEYWRIESRLAAIQRLQAGITTGVSVMGSQSMCYKVSYALEQTLGYAEVGIRNILCCGPGDNPWPQQRSHWSNGKRERYTVEYKEAVETLEEIVSSFNNSNHGLTKIFVTPYKVVNSLISQTDSEKCDNLTEFDLTLSKDMRRIASKYNTRIHTDAFKGMIHLASKDPNALLGEDVHIQHCQGLSFDEVKILADTKTSVSFWPTIAHFNSPAPIIEMMGLGVNVAISTDAPSYTSGHDLFTSMRRAQLIVRALYKERNYLPNEKVLEMVTIDAAKALGLASEIGSLEIGKKADLIAINVNKPHFKPFFDPANLVVRFANINDVEYVFCNGELLLEKSIATKVNSDEICKNAQVFADKLVEDVHITNFAFPIDSQWGKYKAYYPTERFDSSWAEEDKKSGE